MGGRGSKSGAKNSTKSSAAKSEITKPTKAVALPQPETQTAGRKSQMMDLLGQRVTKAHIASMSNEQLKKYAKDNYKVSKKLNKKYREADTNVVSSQKIVRNLEPLVKRYNDPTDKNELAKARRRVTKNQKILKETRTKININEQNLSKAFDESDKRGINLFN
ncbi:MAG: hypothetical protein UR30_C0005G0106 [Candidatus Peregrinibacteria bacterium GW2011_GWC2_33_13]|nr:MAG: hypothetical protein UR30_C0005G0106 [Candidatus Peregrinibacteria bacterium GW2011_GWC2_33_13]